MILCKKCGHAVSENEKICRDCGTRITFSQDDIIYIRRQMEEARRSRDYEHMYHFLKVLADAGENACRREWAAILESGEAGERDLDGAMRYFYLAALENDAYSAYRYSRLVGRTSEEGANFWLAFSAILGCREAFLGMARLLDDMGAEVQATYYYTLSANCDNTDAIITLARRYVDGIGAPKNEAFAKWYMDKLTIPPIMAIKLAYHLRTVKAAEPPAAECENYPALVGSLIRTAKKNGYSTAERKLTEILAEGGDVDAMASLGELYADGVGGKEEPQLALKWLERAAMHGSARAYRTLGNLYLTGTCVEKDGTRALEYYRHAAEHGMPNAYEILGDIYYEGEVVEKDIAYSARLYELAINEGDRGAVKKLAKIKRQREDLFRRAEAAEEAAPEEAFRAYSISVSMGYLPAYGALARAYLLGIGTPPSRKMAYSLFDTAVSLGDPACLFPLGMCYLRGIGTRLDFKKAKNYLLRANALGNERGAEMVLSMLEGKKKKLSRQLYSRAMRLLYLQKFELAKQSLEVAGSIGNPKATYTLGCFYEFGLGVPCDKELAYSLYEEAFKGKFRDPRAAYKLIILKILRHKIKKPEPKKTDKS